MKKSEWLDCQGNEYFPKTKGDSITGQDREQKHCDFRFSQIEKKSKVAVLQLCKEQDPGSRFIGPLNLALCQATEMHQTTGPCIHWIGPNHRIGPEIGLFLCLTDCFFFTRMMCIKDYVFSAICMHLNILTLI